MTSNSFDFLMSRAGSFVTSKEIVNIAKEVYDFLNDCGFLHSFSKEIIEELESFPNINSKFVESFTEFLKTRNLVVRLFKDFRQTHNKEYTSKKEFLRKESHYFFKYSSKNIEFKSDTNSTYILEDVMGKIYDKTNITANSIKDNDLKKLLNIINEILVSNTQKLEKTLINEFSYLAKYIQECLNSSYNNPTNKYTIDSHNLPDTVECIGRENEISEIIQVICISDKTTLFVEGIGGMGKSAIVKDVLKRPEINKRFNKILFLNFTTDIVTLVNDNEQLNINNFDYKLPDSSDTYEDKIELFKRKVTALKKATDLNTLIVVDNFDVNRCDFLEDFIEGPYSLIFTSRNKHDHHGFGKRIEIEQIDSMEDKCKIFFRHCKKADENNPKTKANVDNIIELVGGHTLAIELLAKQINENEVTIDDMIETLKNKGLNNKYKVKYFAAMSKKERSMMEHMLDIFLRATPLFNKEEKLVLTNLALIPHSGISQNEFKALIKRANNLDSAISNLVRSGWVQRQFKNEMSIISLHPVINEVITAHLKPSPSKNKCFNLIENYDNKIKVIGGRSKEEFDSFLSYCMFADRKLQDYESEMIMKLRMSIGIAYSSFANLDAINYGENLIKLYKSYFDDHLGYKMKVYAELAFDYFRIKDDEVQAKEYLDIALNICKSINGIDGFDSYKGIVYNIYGDFVFKNDRKTSIEWRKKALETWDKIKEEYPKDYSISLLNMAWCHHYEKDYKEACRLGEEALKYRLPKEYKCENFWEYEENLKHFGTTYIAKAYSDLGRLYSHLDGDDMIIKSRQYLNTALEMYKYFFGNSHKDVARTYEGLGLSSYMMGDYVLALESFEIADKIFQEKGSEANKATIKFYIARTLNKLGIKEEALKEAETSYKKRLAICNLDNPVVREVQELILELGGNI